MHTLYCSNFFVAIYVCWLVRSVLQAASASQIAFSLSPRRPKHLFDFMDKVQWKSLETNHSFSNLNSTIICHLAKQHLFHLLTFNYVVILLAYLPDHSETACSGPVTYCSDQSKGVFRPVISIILLGTCTYQA